MSSALIEPDEQLRDGFDVATMHSGPIQAFLRARGTLDGASAPLLAEMIAGHLRARRRFLRIDVRDLTVADREAVAVLVRAHQRLLAARGTLILTGVGDALRGALAGQGLDGQLFLLPPAAFEITQAG